MNKLIKKLKYKYYIYVRYITHRIWNYEIAKLLCHSYEKRLINSKQLHELAALFDPTNKNNQVNK